MEDYKKKIEAVLFVTGKSMNIDELAKCCGIGSVGMIKEILEDLKKEYANRNSSLEIVGENDIWKLAVKKDYYKDVGNLIRKTDMDKSLVETLAVIAWKQPMLQSEVVNVRGTLTYDHVKILKELGYVESEKFGRTRKLKLTSKFYDYFDVSREKLKEKFKDVKDVANDLEQIDNNKNLSLVYVPDKVLVNEETNKEN